MSLEDNKTPETCEEAAEVAGISKFSIFGLTDAEYTPDDLVRIFNPNEDEIEAEMTEAIITEMEEEDEELDCPIGCPHKLYLHNKVTDQVLSCKLCECTF